MIPVLSPVLSVVQVCELLGCKPRQIFYMLAAGQLERAPRYGKEIRILTSSVQKAVSRQPSQGRRKRSSDTSTFSFDEL